MFHISKDDVELSHSSGFTVNSVGRHWSGRFDLRSMCNILFVHWSSSVLHQAASQTVGPKQGFGAYLTPAKPDGDKSSQQNPIPHNESSYLPRSL